MNDESNTPANVGTEFAQPASSDTRQDWDFYDLEEDTEELPVEGATKDDGQSADQDPETEKAEINTDEEDESKAATAVDLIELPDGTKIERDEAVKGYLRQADYMRKTTEVATRQKALEAETMRISGITDAFIDYLSRMIPSAPGQELAYRDPNAYTRQKAAHDAAVAEVQELIRVGENAKDAQSKVSQVDHRRIVAEENARLAERFPETTNPKGRQAFFAQATQAAQAAGFSMDEFQGVTDHRLFALAHLASLGMKAQQAQGKAREKAAKAPPATPNRPGNAALQARRKPLPASMSFQDALRRNFD